MLSKFSIFLSLVFQRFAPEASAPVDSFFHDFDTAEALFNKGQYEEGASSLKQACAQAFFDKSCDDPVAVYLRTAEILSAQHEFCKAAFDLLIEVYQSEPNDLRILTALEGFELELEADGALYGMDIELRHADRWARGDNSSAVRAYLLGLRCYLLGYPAVADVIVAPYAVEEGCPLEIAALFVAAGGSAADVIDLRGDDATSLMLRGEEMSDMRARVLAFLASDAPVESAVEEDVLTLP